MTVIQRNRRWAQQRATPRPHGWLVAATLLAAILLVPLIYRQAYAGQIYPGVRVARVHLGGQTPGAALEALGAAGLVAEAPVVLHAEDRSWALPAPELGLRFDSRATVSDAFAVGRRGARPQALGQMVAARLGGKEVAAVVAFDAAAARQTLARLGAEFDRPAQDASFLIDGTAVMPAEAQAGRTIHVDGALAALEALARDGAWPLGDVYLPVSAIEPAVTDVGPTIDQARALLAAPLVLQHAEQTWALEPPLLGPMLQPVRRDDQEIVLDIDHDRLRAWLLPATQSISRTAQLPRFHFNRDTQALELVTPGQAAQTVDVAATAQRILAAGADRTVALALSVTPPPVSDTATAEELGIRELVREETSRFSGSPADRVTNIRIAASQFDGRLLPPDAVVSFNELVGDISAENGYEKTLIIMDGTTAEGVGGGVCQVSTTFFRAAFWAGLPILERQAHGYRVAYYEQGSPVGLDATVYGPVVDLKFKNDTGAWLLVETVTNARAATLTFRFYGTKPGRLVQMQGPVISGQVPSPAARREVDPTLAPGETKKLEYARSGASVSVTRIIRQGDQETREVFRSHYRPTGEVVAVGPAAPAPPPSPAEVTVP
jgi:vancomycin resistance protein YoaR